MAEQTLTAMYDTRVAGENARDQLVGIGVARDAISIRGNGDETMASTHAASEEKGFWASLADFFMPDEDRHIYTEGLKRGSFLLGARVSDELREAAVGILESTHPIDLEERSASWREDGWAGYEPVAHAPTGTTAAVPHGESAGLDEAIDRTVGSSVGSVRPQPATSAVRPSVAPASGADRIVNAASDEVIQLAEEELQVGKREVGRGSVRIRSYVTERPVEEQVELRQERVTIDRQPVDRALQAGDAAFEERTIEAVERGEEAVISKVARVTEEIRLHKEVDHETETVHDSVRKQEVEVEDDREVRKPTGTGTVVEGQVVDPDLAGTNR